MYFQGNTYGIWKLSDLGPNTANECVVVLFLFGDVYKEHWKTTEGSVVALLNASLLPAKEVNTTKLHKIKFNYCSYYYLISLLIYHYAVVSTVVIFSAYKSVIDISLPPPILFAACKENQFSGFSLGKVQL